jgi:HAD superfamily hydrolase (TIGR01484 family)
MECVTEADLAAIARWRDAGNKFGIATGRGLSLILQRVHEYEVPFDFLVCTNGATVFDAELNLLASHAMPTEVRQELLQDEALQQSHYLLFFTTREAEIYRPYPQFRHDLEELSIPEIDATAVRELTDVIQVSLLYSDRQATAAACQHLQERFGRELYVASNQCFIDITVNGIDKGTGLQELVQQQRWEGLPLLAIGDDSNDLPMIDRFQGYTVENAGDAIKQRAAAVYPSVGSMLSAHLV